MFDEGWGQSERKRLNEQSKKDFFVEQCCHSHRLTGVAKRHCGDRRITPQQRKHLGTRRRGSRGSERALSLLG
jgi:hypothetical protein